MPLHNKPFLPPPDARIPSYYTRPTAFLTQPWPIGHASQRPSAAYPRPWQLPVANHQVQPTTNFNPSMLATPPVQHPVTTPTYAQVANPYYYAAAVNRNIPSPSYPIQHIPQHSNNGNQYHRPVFEQRAPESS